MNTQKLHEDIFNTIKANLPQGEQFEVGDLVRGTMNALADFLTQSIAAADPLAHDLTVKTTINNALHSGWLERQHFLMSEKEQFARARQAPPKPVEQPKEKTPKAPKGESPRTAAEDKARDLACILEMQRRDMSPSETSFFLMDYDKKIEKAKDKAQKRRDKKKPTKPK